MGIELDTVHQMDALDLLRSLEPQSVDASISDYPYGATALSWDVMPELGALLAELLRVVKSDGAIITTATQPFSSVLVAAWRKYFRYEGVWDKTRVTRFLDAADMPLQAHEHVLVFGKESPRYTPQYGQGKPYTAKNTGKSPLYHKFERGTTVSDGKRYPTSILRYTLTNIERGLHSTQKPLKLFEYLVSTYTTEGDTVLDPYCGSGVTALAARNTGRHFIVGDNDPQMVETTRNRLQHASDNNVKLLKSGKPVTLPMFAD
jgi:site-specific DNA-methyltransferase (adenine-specific)